MIENLCISNEFYKRLNIFVDKKYIIYIYNIQLTKHFKVDITYMLFVKNWDEQFLNLKTLIKLYVDVV